VTDPTSSGAAPSGTAPAETAHQVAERSRRERLAGLIEDARKGRSEGLTELIEEFTPLLWHSARGQGLSREDAEDVVQAAWLALLGHLGDLRDPGAVVGWLLVVVKRESWRIRASHDRQCRFEPDSMAELPDPAEPMEDTVIEDERRQTVRRALCALPDRCQRLLRLIAFAHQPDYGEVARLLGMPRGSIGPTRGRCLAKLRGLLDSDPRWALTP
jgi:RNA polymerase sigma factor (sigma-70 family)